MHISSIKETRQQKDILITYQLELNQCYVQFRLLEASINFKNFSLAYLKIDAPFKHFNLQPNKSGYLKISAFREAMTTLQLNPTQEADMEVVDEILDIIDSIEEDLQQRLMVVSLLPANPQFDDDNLPLNETQLISKIKSINQEVSNKINVNQQWQLLYVVQTTVKQIWNGEERCIVKLGKTNKSINDYILKLRKTYQQRMDFKALFAQRLYTPGSTLIDTKYFHKKMLKQIPECKLYLQATEDEGNQLHVHYEFYFLTPEFVKTFEELLWNFIKTYSKMYKQDEQDESQSNESLSEQSEDTVNDQFSHQLNKPMEEKLVDQMEILNLTKTKKQEEKIIDRSEDKQELSELNKNSVTENELSKSHPEGEPLEQFQYEDILKDIDDTTLLKSDQDIQIKEIPIQQLSAEGEQLLYEASKMTTKNTLLRAFLYQEQIKRELIANFQDEN